MFPLLSHEKEEPSEEKESRFMWSRREKEQRESGRKGKKRGHFSTGYCNSNSEKNENLRPVHSGNFVYFLQLFLTFKSISFFSFSLTQQFFTKRVISSLKTHSRMSNQFTFQSSFHFAIFKLLTCSNRKTWLTFPSRSAASTFLGILIQLWVLFAADIQECNNVSTRKVKEYTSCIILT